MDIPSIKKSLIAAAQERLAATVAQLESSTTGARQDALEHTVEYGSLYDIAKEEANALQAGFLRQIQKLHQASSELAVLPTAPSTVVELGAIVQISGELYFVSTGAIDKPIQIKNKSYQLVSAASPLIRLFIGKPIGSTAVLAGRKITLESLY